MSGERLLIVNADDFGRSAGINRGIVAAYENGIVTSTTLMVNTAWTDDAVGRACRCTGLGVGLHLNFCYGRPVAAPGDIPSLVRSDGLFESDLARLKATARASDIAIETQAQVERFRALTGRPPTHLDSHKYLHSNDPFSAPVVAVASDLGLPMRATCRRDRECMSAANVRHPDRFEGRFHGHEGDGVSIEVLRKLIVELEPGLTELMCHPGYLDAQIMGSSYRDDRERELATLCHPDIAALIVDHEVMLATFGALGESGR